ncbi:hypothetical protein [Phenylobacterium sp.]|uniref:hypothetical protein n=1 Tax=Phenylobacterium sp. TaxID=1871053 RepID=UPI002DE47F4C|nr:hypothetical protein [Phenylobacterium sp.]
MTRFSVIEGGVPAGAPRPVVWNRPPLTGQIIALVVRDTGDAREPLEACYDDGRPFLVGIRRFRPPVDQPALDAWIARAVADGLHVVDQRAPSLATGSISTRQAIELEQRRRAQPRAAEPLPAGGLFDLVRRDQGELF